MEWRRSSHSSDCEYKCYPESMARRCEIGLVFDSWTEEGMMQRA
jgi:hypothetical protein